MDVNINLPKRLKYGDNYYMPNYQGLKMLMLDLQYNDQEAYINLLPEFSRIEKWRKAGLIIGGTSIAAGGIMNVFGLKKAVKRLDSNIEDLATSGTFPLEGFGLILGGAIISGLGIYFTFSGYLWENDFYRFINKHNSLDRDEKIIWEIGLTSNSYNGTGLSVGCKF
ncbi:MAG: hypothetical protein JEZ09_02205 [Salinivirgaceae bacterium]|nr:hypothetical protein [Salinivirgaceae bacterium]